MKKGTSYPSSYSYDENGLRTTKTVVSASGTSVNTYLYDTAGTLLRQVVENPDGTTDIMEFMYDESGRPYAVLLNSTIYYYILNLQGDVVQVADSWGRTHATYTYNAWGKLLSAQAGSYSGAQKITDLNPLRYRGYYYDTDTQLYYLQSRYYDPNLGRFLNADAFASTGQGLMGNNMLAYCNNNPVILADPYGDFGLFTLANAVIGAVVGAATQIATNVLTKSDNVFAGVVGAAVGGAVYNVVAITTGSLVAASAAGSAAEALANEAGSYISGEKELTSDNLRNL